LAQLCNDYEVGRLPWEVIEREFRSLRDGIRPRSNRQLSRIFLVSWINDDHREPEHRRSTHGMKPVNAPLWRRRGATQPASLAFTHGRCPA
jgi:hypothetical protein